MICIHRCDSGYQPGGGGGAPLLGTAEQFNRGGSSQLGLLLITIKK